MTTGERIKEIRKEKALTLERFGEKIGLQKSSLSQIERGIINASAQTIKSVCREFDVSEEWLRTGEGAMYVQRPRNEAIERELRQFLTVEEGSFKERLISLLLHLPPEHWETLERYARQLVENRPAEQHAPAPEPVPEDDREELHALLDRQLDGEKDTASGA